MKKLRIFLVMIFFIISCNQMSNNDNYIESIKIIRYPSSSPDMVHINFILKDSLLIKSVKDKTIKGLYIHNFVYENWNFITNTKGKYFIHDSLCVFTYLALDFVAFNEKKIEKFIESISKQIYIEIIDNNDKIYIVTYKNTDISGLE